MRALRWLRCRVFGHRWEPEHVDYGNGFGDVYVGDICRWCFRAVPIYRQVFGTVRVSGSPADSNPTGER